jgi:hypothetical protein
LLLPLHPKVKKSAPRQQPHTRSVPTSGILPRNGRPPDLSGPCGSSLASTATASTLSASLTGSSFRLAGVKKAAPNARSIEHGPGGRPAAASPPAQCQAAQLKHLRIPILGETTAARPREGVLKCGGSRWRVRCSLAALIAQARRGSVGHVRRFVWGGLNWRFVLPQAGSMRVGPLSASAAA